MRKVTGTIAQEIIQLRQKGYSVPEISNLVPVSKTTVLRYVNGVEILPEYLKNWAGKRGGSRKRKSFKEAQALEAGKIFVKQLSEREKLLFLTALYWAEGSKKDFSLSNTDPRLIKVFISGIRDCLGIDNSRIRISMRLYEDLDPETCLTFWSSITEIPKEDFVNIEVLAGKKKGKLKYGMCRVRVLKGGDILKKIMGINKAIYENLPL